MTEEDGIRVNLARKCAAGAAMRWLVQHGNGDRMGFYATHTTVRSPFASPMTRMEAPLSSGYPSTATASQALLTVAVY